jgi:hypothetical protein
MKQLPGLKENDIEHAARDYLLWTGWYTFHLQQSLGCHPGIADRYAIKDGVSVWIEFKKPGGRQSDYQKLFQAEVKRHGGVYILAKSVEDVIEGLKGAVTNGV